MSPSYFVPGLDRTGKVHELFQKIAPRYDLINDIQSFGLHRFWKARLVALAGVSRNQNALDLCTGTGDIALRLARAGVDVVGCDFSEAMLDQARKRNPTIRWKQCDALNLAFPDNFFDLVTIGYGLRNLADFRRGIEEMVRVVKPGGRILILEFGKPRNRLWRAIYFTYLRAFVPLLGWLFCRDRAAYGYILESLTHYPGAETIQELLAQAGCARPKIRHFLGGVMSINYAEKG